MDTLNNNLQQGYRLPDDPWQYVLNQLIDSGGVEIIDPDIIKLPGGTIEFRDNDQWTIQLNESTGVYERVWPSREAFARQTLDGAARRFIR